MRHVLHSAGRGKRVARQLRNAYATFGHDLAHVASLNLAARLYGYRSWRECHAEVGRAPASHDDSKVGSEIVDLRRAHHEQVLIADGRLDAATCKSLIAALAPTARGGGMGPWHEAYVAQMRTAVGVRNLLGRVADCPNPEITDLSVEPVQADDGLWHLITWKTSQQLGKVRFDTQDGLAIRNDGHVMAGEFQGTTGATRLAELRPSQGHWSSASLTHALGDLGLWSAVEASEQPSEAHAASSALRAAFACLDAEVLSLFCTGLDCTVGSYTYLRMLPRHPNGFWDLLQRAPLLVSTVISLTRQPFGQDAAHLKALRSTRDALATLANIVAEKGVNSRQARSVLERFIGQQPYLRKGVPLYILTPLTAFPASAVPAEPADWAAMVTLFEYTLMIQGTGIGMDRLHASLRGSDWQTLHLCWPRRRCDRQIDGNVVYATSGSLAFLVAQAFAEVYSVSPDVVTDAPFKQAIEERILARIVGDGDALPVLRRMTAYLDRACPDDDAEEAPSMASYADGMRSARDVLPPDLQDLDPPTFLRRLGYDPDLIAGLLLREPDLAFDDQGEPQIEPHMVEWDPVEPDLSRIGLKEQDRIAPLEPTILPLPPGTRTPRGWSRHGETLHWAKSPYRIRHSDGTREVISGEPGFYLDLGQFWHDAEPTYPARLARFDSLAEAVAYAKQHDNHAADLGDAA